MVPTGSDRFDRHFQRQTNLTHFRHPSVSNQLLCAPTVVQSLITLPSIVVVVTGHNVAVLFDEPSQRL
jgi:hypothetical protein